MRRPRDYDSELKALDDKAKRLKDRKLRELGELVVACGADTVPPEELAGALLDIVRTTDAATKEGWRTSGAAFFHRSSRKAARSADRDTHGMLPLVGDAAQN